MTRRLVRAALAAALSLALCSCAAGEELLDLLPEIEIVIEAPDGAAPTATDAAPEGAPGGSPDGTLDAAAVDATLATLAQLPVKGRAPMTGYERDEFGHGWIDVDRNGCDTRNDILARDLVDLDRPAGCRVLAGLLDDPYTGRSISFVRGEGTSQLVQIDHVVPLANAWVTGAQRLAEEERVAFANDPRNLLAVDGPTNAQKGAGDAATWLPPDRSFRCEYVARQVEVKASYGLWVTAPEREAMVRVLEGCRPAA
ncbi:HNH endonuclease family protein [Agromyces aurantiacus]|uniref:HNH endonuclease family protein n=1 Tax=Agromyces aurantiacus TaxID=165814 RepID=A0ABV9R2C2_9MICO|nr:HNH endonuclease family protein [Agromyces aurantiacus]MBM7506042.1 hypothetical protein [Agromyces aurantiacus]